MICVRCRRRFGRIGENYWNAQGGTCPICQESDSATTFLIKPHHEEKPSKN